MSFKEGADDASLKAPHTLDTQMNNSQSPSLLLPLRSGVVATALLPAIARSGELMYNFVAVALSGFMKT